jgi:hypothetical protein
MVPGPRARPGFFVAAHAGVGHDPEVVPIVTLEKVDPSTFNAQLILMSGMRVGERPWTEPSN